MKVALYHPWVYLRSGIERWMVDGGDRSAAVTLDRQGKAAEAPALPSLPLDDLRRQVRDLVKKP